MKKLTTVLLVLLLLGCGSSDKKVRPDAEVTVNIAARYLDNILMNTLSSLELLASTAGAESADWQNIKPSLEILAEKLPGVYFFLLPDGNYYSVTKDYTNLNLSNRPYFRSLFEGNPVFAYPAYSRSSGKRAAIMAAPIMKEGKTVAALGVSVFLDDLNAKLNRDLDLPGDHIWYVLDAEGNTMLKNESDYIFLNALNVGSESLKEALGTALKKESGVMHYEMNGKKTAYYRKLPHIDWWLMIAKIEGPVVEDTDRLDLSLEQFVPELKKSLESIDHALAATMKNAETDFRNESEVRELLAAILEKEQNIVESSFITLDGILRYIEPADYKNFEHSDISMQEHVIALRKDPKPEFSSAFMSVEGFLAVDLAYPVYDEENRLFGSVSVLIRPELLVEALLRESRVPEDYELWIMQTDGMIIYDQDPEEIGKILFSDPAYAGYESLLALGRKIAEKPRGEGSYVYFAPQSEEKVVKDVLWESISMHGREWRVVLGYRPFEKKE